MDRVGRRSLHLIGMAGMIVCSIVITVALNYNTSNGVGIILIIATLSYAVFFAVGPGSIPWMAAGELFTQGSRASAISIGVFVNWLANFTMGLVFPQLESNLEEFLFIPICIIMTVLFSVLFIYFPETKNRTANDLSLLFQIPNAWKQAIGLQQTNIEQPQEMTSCDDGYTNHGSNDII